LVSAIVKAFIAFIFTPFIIFVWPGILFLPGGSHYLYFAVMMFAVTFGLLAILAFAQRRNKIRGVIAVCGVVLIGFLHVRRDETKSWLNEELIVGPSKVFSAPASAVARQALVLRDHFSAESGLDPHGWATDTLLLEALARDQGSRILGPTLVFGTSGMKM